jgi:hypothetical protein
VESEYRRVRSKEQEQAQVESRRFHVFVAWSGTSSKQVGLLVHKWLGDVFHTTISVFISPVDIAPGSIWPDELWTNLLVADFGIICLTPENLGNVWLHFEAGVIAKGFPDKDARLCPLLFALEPGALTGPLGALRQATWCSEEGMLRLARSIDAMLPPGFQSKEKVTEKFGTYWPALEKALSEIPKPTAPPKAEARVEASASDLLPLLRTLNTNDGALSQDLRRALELLQTIAENSRPSYFSAAADPTISLSNALGKQADYASLLGKTDSLSPLGSMQATGYATLLGEVASGKSASRSDYLSELLGERGKTQGLAEALERISAQGTPPQKKRNGGK